MAGRVRKAVEAVEELCEEHFPHGWSHVDPQFAAVGCEHGSFDRPADPEPEQSAPEKPADPAAPPAA